MEFMTTRPYITDWNERNLGMGGNKTLYALMRKSLDLYNAPIKAALAHIERQVQAGRADA